MSSCKFSQLFRSHMPHFLTAGIVASFAYSTPAVAAPDAPTSSGSTTDGGTIDLGYNGDFAHGQKNTFYYQVSYKGQMLSHSGTPITATDITKSFQTPSALQSSSSDASDVNAYSIAITQGSAKISSGLFNAIGVTNRTIPISILQYFRGSSQISGTIDGKILNTAVGIESLPLHPLAWLGFNKQRTATDWFLVGLDGERESGTGNASSSASSSSNQATTVTQTSGLLTYRTFIGKAFGWHVTGINNITADQVLGEAKTYQEAIAKSYVVAGTGTSAIQNEIIELVQPFNQFTHPMNQPPNHDQEISPSWWKNAVAQDVSIYNSAHGDTPREAIYFDSSGWYTLSGNPQGSRAKAIYGVSFEHWIGGNRKTQSIAELRYEEGYDRAAPKIRSNRLLAIIKAAF